MHWEKMGRDGERIRKTQAWEEDENGGFILESKGLSGNRSLYEYCILCTDTVRLRLALHRPHHTIDEDENESHLPGRSCGNRDSRIHDRNGDAE